MFISTANTTGFRATRSPIALVEVPVGRQLLLRLNVYNVTDAPTSENINNNGGRYNPGTPRSFLLSSAIRF